MNFPGPQSYGPPVFYIFPMVSSALRTKLLPASVVCVCMCVSFRSSSSLSPKAVCSKTKVPGNYRILIFFNIFTLRRIITLELLKCGKISFLIILLVRHASSILSPQGLAHRVTSRGIQLVTVRGSRMFCLLLTTLQRSLPELREQKVRYFCFLVPTGIHEGQKLEILNTSRRPL